jgi:hypothetical protein
VFFLPNKYGEIEQEITISLRKEEGRGFAGETSLKSDKVNVGIA